MPKAPLGRARPDAQDPTPVWKVVSELSSLHSQIAITETLITHLEANYLGSGEVEADDFIIRNDFARVPPPHLDEYLGLLYDMRNGFEARLQGLNQMTVGPHPDELEEEEDVVELEEFPVEESLEDDEELEEGAEEDSEEDAEEAEEEEPEDEDEEFEDDEDDEGWEEDDEEEEEVDDDEDSEVSAPVPARGGHKRGNAGDRRGSSRVSAVAQ